MRQAFERVASSIAAAFKAGAPSSQELTPPELIDSIQQLLELCEQLDREYGQDKKVIYHDISLVADHVINALSDLGIWAESLGLTDEKYSLDQVALQAAQWATRHGGIIRSLLPIVNAFAQRANRTQDKEQLVTLFHEMRRIIEHTEDSIKADTDKLDPARPWKILNLNYAIVATRTQLPEFMTLAYSDLELNLPDECPEFFEEGLKQAEKAVYGPVVKTIMKRYFDKWTTRH